MLCEALACVAETIELVSDDLNRFLRSKDDEIPTSLKQLAKIAWSDEFTGSIMRASEALTVGVVRGIDSASRPEGTVGYCSSESRIASPSFSDRFLDKFFSQAGTGFASVVVGSFARNLVLAVCSRGPGCESVSSHGEEAIPAWFRVLSDDRSKELIGNCIERFVGTAVTVYLEKTMAINSYDQIFSGLTNPKNEAKVKDILVSVCNGAVETLVRTSHQVMSNVDSSSSLLSRVAIEQEGQELVQTSCIQKSDVYMNSTDFVGWVDRVSSTLAVPSNRKLVLDVTGRVTFETVRSFLDFMSGKLCDSASRGARVVHKEAAQMGLDVVRYVSTKSMALYTICLALCMQICVGTRLLTPA